ncbi:hypothetical protein [Collimonas arenae]|uniref:hypothetical protein n=1 Tax=Collimonas arenae TaxID=279058 RepID=UPI00056E26C3|nr:hypothetical protein [Collimonas arenae]
MVNSPNEDGPAARANGHATGGVVGLVRAVLGKTPMGPSQNVTNFYDSHPDLTNAPFHRDDLKTLLDKETAAAQQTPKTTADVVAQMTPGTVRQGFGHMFAFNAVTSSTVGQNHANLVSEARTNALGYGHEAGIKLASEHYGQDLAS